MQRFREQGYEEIRPGVFKVPIIYELEDDYLEVHILNSNFADIYHHVYSGISWPLYESIPLRECLDAINDYVANYLDHG